MVPGSAARRAAEDLQRAPRSLATTSLRGAERGMAAGLAGTKDSDTYTRNEGRTPDPITSRRQACVVGKGKAALLWRTKSVGGWIPFQKSHQKPQEQMETPQHPQGSTGLAPLCLSSPDSLQKNLAATGEQLRLEQLRMV